MGSLCFIQDVDLRTLSQEHVIGGLEPLSGKVHFIPADRMYDI